MIERLRARNEWKFAGVLPRADRALAIALVDACSCCAACCRPASRSRWARWSARCSAARRSPRRSRWWASCSCCCRCWRRSTRRSAPTSAAAPPPGSTTGSRAACVRAAGHGPPRESRAHQRPRDGARLRPRHQRAAAAHLDGLHRERAGRAGRRARVGGCVLAAYAWWAPLAARRRLARHALAAARERRVARPQDGRGARGAAPRGLRLPARGRSARGEGAAPVRPRGLDGRALPRAPAAPVRAALAGDAAARAAGALEPAARARRERRRVRVARRRPPPTAASRSIGWSPSRAPRSARA